MNNLNIEQGINNPHNLDPIFIREGHTEDIIRRVFGWRWTARTQLMVKIIDVFSVFETFSRKDIISAFGKDFNLRVIDRAILTMECHGLTVCVQTNQSKLCGGALFKVQSSSFWHAENTGHTEGFERHRGMPSKAS